MRQADASVGQHSDTLPETIMEGGSSHLFLVFYMALKPLLTLGRVTRSPIVQAVSMKLAETLVSLRLVPLAG